MPETPPTGAQQLRQMLDGFRVTQAISTAVELGIPDALASGEQTSDELARVTNTDAPSLYRVLRALAATGVLEEREGRVFALAPMAEPLRSDVPGSLAAWARYLGRPYYWNSWGNLVHSVRTGETGFSALYGGSVWDYREAHPEENAFFNAAMASLTNAAVEGLLAAYDFSPYGVICDIGGGSGVLLASILRRNANARGIVFDMPHVVASAAPIIEWARVSSRCTTVGGDMFAAIPEGADAYTIKSILHDWNDEDCLRILKTAQSCMRSDAKLLVLERVVDGPNEGTATKLSDLNMLVVAGGRERTEEEWRELLAAGGFALERIMPTTAGFSVLEAVPN